MKKTKLLMAGLLASAVASVASANTEIYLTGSTAFRSAVVDSIKKVLAPGYVWGSTGGSGGSANQQVFVGTTLASPVSPHNTYPIIIQCSWSGSAGGIQSVAASVAAGQPYLDEPVVISYSSPNATVDGTALAGGSGATLSVNTNSHVPDMAMSDAFIESTPFQGGSYVTLTSTPVGIVPFEFVKGEYTPDGTTTHAVAGGYPGVTNLTVDQAQELIGGGIALDQLTGVAADDNKLALCIGRDHDSGTRIGAEYDTQLGGDVFEAQDAGYEAGVLQYLPNGAICGSTQFATQSPGTAGTTIETLVAWQTTDSTGTPNGGDEVVLGEDRGGGTEGFFSGGNVAKALARPVDTSSAAFFSANAAYPYTIGYLGMSDANSVNADTNIVSYTDGANQTDSIKATQNALTFGGYSPSSGTGYTFASAKFAPPYDHILNGQYAFWGVEHLLYPQNLASTHADRQDVIANLITPQITTEADFNGTGIKLSAMNASRANDGQAISSPSAGFTE
jgi:hypothetical protein